MAGPAEAQYCSIGKLCCLHFIAVVHIFLTAAPGNSVVIAVYYGSAVFAFAALVHRNQDSIVFPGILLPGKPEPRPGACPQENTLPIPLYHGRQIHGLLPVLSAVPADCHPQMHGSGRNKGGGIRFQHPVAGGYLLPRAGHAFPDKFRRFPGK